ncbi:hypothetical protein LVJ94_06020 [Pendulispora rubella]|uniref:Uncharacterized protein n=1 Tax=Pendulispora rubella TaxID=2741070 RepID=A0ABZ2L780_9BACT
MVQPTTTSNASNGSEHVVSPGCCAPFDPAEWDKDEITWNERPFLRESVRSFFHVPLDMRQKAKRGTRLVEAADAAPERGIILCEERSRWGANLYIEATRPIAGADMAFLSGTYLTKVYEGPYRDAPIWVQDMQTYVSSEGASAEKIYFWYTTCPRCAKAYGKNYVVLFAELSTRA